jgi:proteasome accessory factor C
MPEPAPDRLLRLLQLLPLAARDGGVAYDELAEVLGVTRDQLDRDLAEITDRDYYHTAETGSDIQIILDADRVRVWTTGHLRRPTRLTPGEAAALDLGARILAAEREAPGVVHQLRALRERLAWRPDPAADHVIADGDPAAADAIRALLVDAARRRAPVRIRYLKPDAHAPEDRAVEPYTVVYGAGQWYVVGRAPEHDGVRIFRVDRILEARLDDVAPAPFEPPADFDAADYMAGGAVYYADQEVEVAVRYAGRIAPWLKERAEFAPLPDGDVLVRHSVADPGWLVRHVLQYGRHARVLQPEWVAAMVRQTVARVAEGEGEGE